MQIVPLSAVPSQQVAILLNGQSCNIYVKTTRYGMYLDLYVSGILVLAGVPCQNLNRIVRSAYLGFVGDLAFYDTQGTLDPSYDGLGSRYVLLYLEPSDPQVAS